jgi:hypothetical protein
MTVNVVLVLLLLLAICLGAVSLGWPLVTRQRAMPVAGVESSPTAPSPLRSTTEVNNLEVSPTEAAPPTAPPATPEPTVPVAAGLQCSVGETFNGFYDCLITNPGSAPDELSLYVQAAGGQSNGFSPSVMIDEQGNFLPDSTTSLVPLGDFEPDETRPVRLILSCLAATGCPSTTFILSLWTDRGTQQAPGSELRLTAAFPTANQ